MREYDYPSYSDDTSYSGNGTDDDTKEIVIGSIVGGIIIVVIGVIITVLVIVYWRVPESRPFITLFFEFFHGLYKLFNQMHNDNYEGLS